MNNYIGLNDDVFWATARVLAERGDARAKMLSSRLLLRRRLKVLDVSAELGHDPAAQTNAELRLDQELDGKLGVSAFKDTAPNHLYGRTGGEAAKAHKTVRVLNGGGIPMEITDFPDTIISKWLTKKKSLVRYYFLETEERDAAERFMKGR